MAAPRKEVWAAINDPAVLARCIPGCESMEATSDTERTARVAVKIGPVRARFTGHIRMLDVRAGEGCTLQFEGSGGAAGIAKGQSSVSLSDEGEGTRLRYTAQASVGGKLGQVGGRMIDAAAKQMADQFFVALQSELAQADEPPAAPQTGEQAAAHVSESPSTGVGDPAAPSGAAVRSGPVIMPGRATPASSGEGVRVLWFALGALSTGFGVWIASVLFA